MSNVQTIEGTLIQILKSESGVSKSGKEWQKQEFLVETTEQFPKKICFTLFADKMSLLNGFTEGDSVSVNYNIESRDFNGKWYHNVTCWKIEKLNGGSQTTGTQNNYQTTGLLPPTEYATQEQLPDDDSLPF